MHIIIEEAQVRKINHIKNNPTVSDRAGILTEVWSSNNEVNPPQHGES